MNWMSDFGPIQSVSFSENFQYSCAMTLYRDCEDSELTVRFFEKFIELSTYCNIGDLEVVEHLLHAARMCDFNIRGEKTYDSSLTDFFIERSDFQAVPSILKYEDTVYYTDAAYEYLKVNELEDMSMLENRISKSRLYRIMQIMDIFGHHNPDLNLDQSGTSEALRLVWSSIPDNYVSLEEMIEAYDHVYSSNFIRQAHGFYEDSIGQTVSHREPRVLIQYCRTEIRRCLYQSKQWLPDGINKLNIPTRFKPYLNLQTDDPGPIFRLL